jgi:hypothetical protein
MHQEKGDRISAKARALTTLSGNNFPSKNALHPKAATL